MWNWSQWVFFFHFFLPTIIKQNTANFESIFFPSSLCSCATNKSFCTLQCFTMLRDLKECLLTSLAAKARQAFILIFFSFCRYPFLSPTYDFRTTGKLIIWLICTTCLFIRWNHTFLLFLLAYGNEKSFCWKPSMAHSTKLVWKVIMEALKWK